VGPQLGYECEQGEALITESHGAAGLDIGESHGTVGLDSGGQGNDPVRCPSSLSLESGQSEDTGKKVLPDGDDLSQDSRLMHNIIISGNASGQSARHGRLDQFVNGIKFEVGSAVVLFLFCVVTALEMQGEGMSLGYKLGYPRHADPAGTVWSEIFGVLRILSICFGGVFALEVLIRLMAAGKRFLCDLWNILDVVILAGWFVELTGVRFNSKVLRLARFVRVLRCLRMIHIVRHLENLYFMVKALNACWRALGWACVLFFALQTFTAFVIFQILSTVYFSDEGRPIQERQEVFLYFGSFVRSLLTSFEMTMGNWPTPARVLFENVSEWFMMLFLLHKLVVGFAFVGVINAMFTQETFQIAMTDDLTMVLKKQRYLRTQKVKLQKLFLAADSDGDGRVSRSEFATILRHNDVKLWLASMDYDPKDPNYLFTMLDKNGSGDLSATEFLRGMTRLRGFARAMDLLHLGKQQEQIENIIEQEHLGRNSSWIHDDYHDEDDDGNRMLAGLLKV
jgi:hypothetical protein